MTKSKLGNFEAILLILSTLVPFTVISLSRTLINDTKSSTLLNIIYISTICLFIVFFIYKLFKNFPGLDILDISQYLGGTLFKNVIGFIFILYFITTSSIFLRNFCEGLKVVYFPYTDIIYVILLFIVTFSLTNTLSFNSTIKTTSIIFPLLLVSIVLLFIGNFTNFSFFRIFPILGDGLKSTFLLGLSNIGCFAGILYIYFLPPLLKEPEKLKTISILAIILSGVFILICVATLLFMFSIYISTDEIMPLFSVSRYIEFGSFFQRFESLFLLIWTISFCCYLSISCKFSTYVLKKTLNLKDSRQLTYLLLILTFAITILPKNYSIINYFETNIYRYLSILIILLGIFILVLSNLKNRKQVIK